MNSEYKHGRDVNKLESNELNWMDGGSGKSCENGTSLVSTYTSRLKNHKFA